MVRGDSNPALDPHVVIAAHHPDSSVIEVVVESLDPNIDGPELNRRALLLIRAFRSYMMATENRHNTSLNPQAIKAELWQPAGR